MVGLCADIWPARLDARRLADARTSQRHRRFS
jgi:hypothetical protein